jgi:hypothetical protein
MTPATSPKIEMRSTQSVTIDVVNDAFRPWPIEAQLGQPLVVRLRNKGLTAHTFTVYDRRAGDGDDPAANRLGDLAGSSAASTMRGGMHGGVSLGRPPPGG